MNDFWAIRVGNVLVPDGTESIAAFAKLPFGKPMKVEVKQPRNLQHHKLFWALCQRIADGIGSTAENVSDVLKIGSGHFSLVRTKTYGDLKLPKSIAFNNMDQTEFHAFFERCVQTIYSEWAIDPASVADLLTPEEVQKHG